MRRETRRNVWAALGAGTVAALVGVACDQPVSPEANRLPAELDGPEYHVGCPAGQKFTGGGRIDPSGEKITFGFNVHANDDCEPIKGQLQVVHHPTQSKYHAGTTSSGGSITHFSSFTNSTGGECAEFSGTIRVKHGNGDWHTHDFRVEVCDNGEPGRGRDTFSITVSGEETGPGHGSTGRTVLTGGNIQAH